jgi:lipid II:glycine glycyltransferase (peptidoglycan interpeptide bridge formation enzyme)
MYANIMVKFGYRAQFLGIVNDQNKLMGATLIIYKEVFMGNKIAYAPRGILFNYEEEADTKELADKLKKVLGKQGFMLLRMDPYVPLTIRDAEGNIMNFNNKGNSIIDNLKKAGFEYKGKTVYFETEKPRWEALVLLQRDIREIFAKLDKHTRNKIRRAINSGIDVVKDESKSINKLYNFVGRKEKKPLSYYKTICEKFEDDVDIYYAKINTETFLINSRRSYEKEVEYNESLAARVQDMSLDERERNTYLNKKMESDKLITSYKNNLLKATDLLKSNPDGIIIAGAMIIKYDNAAYIFTEGMDEDYAYLDPNYLIKWQLICDYNNLGFKYLNLDGIAGEFEGENNYKGLNESKLGFNSTITEYIGEFDIVLNSFTYNWYKKTKK